MTNASSMKTERPHAQGIALLLGGIHRHSPTQQQYQLRNRITTLRPTIWIRARLDAQRRLRLDTLARHLRDGGGTLCLTSEAYAALSPEARDDLHALLAQHQARICICGKNSANP